MEFFFVGNTNLNICNNTAYAYIFFLGKTAYAYIFTKISFYDIFHFSNNKSEKFMIDWNLR